MNVMGRGEGSQQSAVTHAVSRQQEFIEPWNDLGVRIKRGMAELRHLQSQATGSRLFDLTLKMHAFEEALTIYESLADSTVSQGDYAGAWRSFTDAIESNSRRAVHDIARKSGFGAVLSYQRGYGEQIDAPQSPLG